MTLDEAIKHCEEKSDCTECGMEYRQLRNWLKMAQKYISRDTPKMVKNGCLVGNYICPSCGELMALAVENYCDKCGQAIRFK